MNKYAFYRGYSSGLEKTAVLPMLPMMIGTGLGMAGSMASSRPGQSAPAYQQLGREELAGFGEDVGGAGYSAGHALNPLERAAQLRAVGVGGLGGAGLGGYLGYQMGGPMGLLAGAGLGGLGGAALGSWYKDPYRMAQARIAARKKQIAQQQAQMQQ